MTNVVKLAGVTLPGDGYPHISSFKEIYLSVTDGLLGLYSIRGSIGLSLKNYADGGSNMTVIGSPTMQDDGAICNYYKCFDKGIPAHVAFKFISLAKHNLPSVA